MKNKKIITIRNAVIKTDKRLTQKAFLIMKEKGIFVFLRKFINFFLNFIKRFFREYLPLKILYFFSSNGEIMKNIQGSKMILDLKDLGISRELALYGVHEKSSTKQIKRILVEGMRIVEVGANIGYYVLIEARLVGEEGYIYAFEPSPYNFNFLKRNIEINGYHNIEIYQKAVGDKNEIARFFITDRSNLSSFVERENIKNKNIIDVEIIKLDDFLKDKKINLIRMDVEGYEIEVLKGLRKTLNNDNAPEYLFIEIHSELLHKRNSSAKEIIRYLEKFGYSVIKGFYRGHAEISVSTTQELINHPYLEEGYWETFLKRVTRSDSNTI